MHARILAQTLTEARRRYGVVAISGPRQSGKSTLARMAAPELPVVHLEDPIELALIHGDWRGFFNRHPDGAIIDEAQRLPELMSALQAEVDRDPRPGRWILTGSQQFELNRHISQSLAGRCARLDLWPFAIEELAESPRRPRSLAEAIFTGGMAPLHDPAKSHDVIEWLAGYVRSAFEKDIADVLVLRDHARFANFLTLCASSTGTEITKERFADTIGIDGKTVEAWLSALETTRLILRLSPHTRAFGKRLVRRQKLYFTDTGLACRLMHRRDVSQIEGSHEWGALVETFAVMEILKARQHRGSPPDLWYWRSSDGHEVDLILDQGTELLPIEIKASATPDLALARGLRHLRDLGHRDPRVRVLPGLVVYGGTEELPLGDDRLVAWNRIAAAPELLR